MISYHPSLPDPSKAKLYAPGFKIADTDDIERIAKGISKFVWSPIIFKNGYRHGDNFVSCDWAVLDFDDGEMTLGEAIKEFCDSAHIIGTTKSHQVQKGNSPPCDRFRVMIKFNTRITDKTQYCYNMARFVNCFPVDRQCKDAARFFFPCKTIVSINTDPDAYTQEVCVETPSAKEKRRNLAFKENCSAWAIWRLYKEIPVGERNVTAYRIAKDLYRSGHAPDEILTMILASPTYQNKASSYVLSELRDAVKSAVKKVNQERAES